MDNMEEQQVFDSNKHAFIAHVTYSGAKLSVHAGPDTDNISIPSSTSKSISDNSAHQIIHTIYYPKEINLFRGLKQPTLVDPFIQEVGARAPDAQSEIYRYIERMLTYGHKIGREIYQQISPSLLEATSPDQMYDVVTQAIHEEKENRTFIEQRLPKYQSEIDAQFPKLKAYFEQDYNGESNYIRIEKEDIETELLLFGIENYIKNVAHIDPGFIHRN